MMRVGAFPHTVLPKLGSDTPYSVSCRDDVDVHCTRKGYEGYGGRLAGS